MSAATVSGEDYRLREDMILYVYDLSVDSI